MFAGIDLMMMTAERGDLDDVAAEDHVRQSKTTTDQTAVGEQLFDLFRRRIGDDVKVFWLAPQQQIADTTADQIGFETRFVQPVEHFQGIVTDLPTRDRMLIPSQDTAFTGLTEGDGAGFIFFAQDFAAKISDLGKYGTPPNRQWPVIAAL